MESFTEIKIFCRFPETKTIGSNKQIKSFNSFRTGFKTLKRIKNVGIQIMELISSTR